MKIIVAVFVLAILSSGVAMASDGWIAPQKPLMICDTKRGHEMAEDLIDYGRKNENNIAIMTGATSFGCTLTFTGGTWRYLTHNGEWPMGSIRRIQFRGEINGWVSNDYLKKVTKESKKIRARNIAERKKKEAAAERQKRESQRTQAELQKILDCRHWKYKNTLRCNETAQFAGIGIVVLILLSIVLLMRTPKEWQ